MNNKVAIYTRLSREDEDKIDGKKESRSIENQVKVLSDYAYKNNYEIFNIYYDDGYSGANQDRPGLKKLLTDATNHKFNILLIKDLSRLGRTMHQVGKLIGETFPILKIRVIALSDNYDSETYNDDESVVIRNFLNAYYLKDFKKKIHKSIQHRSKSKHMRTYIKYGYMDDAKGERIVDPYASNIIIRIFKEYILGKSPTLIAKDLTCEKVLPRGIYIDKMICKKNKYVRATANWSPSSITNIISDYEYCGNVINLRYSKFYAPVTINNMLPAIIDEETFKKANELRKSRSHTHKNQDHIADLICDPTNDKRHASYSLSYKEPRYSIRSTGTSISVKLLHIILYEDVLETIEECLSDVNKFYNIYKNKLFKNVSFNKSDIEKKKKALYREYEELFEKYCLEKVSKSYFESIANIIIKDIGKCDKALEDFGLREYKFTLFNTKFKAFLEDIKKLNNTKFSLELIRMAISKVYIHDYTKKRIYNKIYKIEIKYKFEES